MTTRARGWYRDPDHPSRHRWWTGEDWQSQEERLDEVVSSAVEPGTGGQAPTDPT